MRLVIFKLVSIFVSIWATSINFVKCVHNSPMPAMNFIVMALGWTAFIYLFAMRKDE